LGRGLYKYPGRGKEKKKGKDFILGLNMYPYFIQPPLIVPTNDIKPLKDILGNQCSRVDFVA
jgi:hypothetical protein